MKPMGKKRFCPDCEGELEESGKSGVWYCQDCDWSGIYDNDD